MGKIISKEYAQRLIRAGRARESGLTCDGSRWPDGNHYVIIDRLDRNRTDQYLDNAR